MQPPKELDVLDRHKGFTAITLAPTSVKIVMGQQGEREAKYPDDYPDGKLAPQFIRWDSVMRERDTVWRPGQLLRKTTIGTLQEFNEQSFYQNNNDVTQAIYKVPGYRFRIAVWFDNQTGERIA